MRTTHNANTGQNNVSGEAGPVKLKIVEILEAASGLLTIADTAQLLNVSPKLIYKLVAAGKLPASRIAGSLRLDPNSLIAWIGQQQTFKP